jgi:hypothetical protein
VHDLQPARHRRAGGVTRRPRRHARTAVRPPRRPGCQHPGLVRAVGGLSRRQLLRRGLLLLGLAGRRPLGGRAGRAGAARRHHEGGPLRATRQLPAGAGRGEVRQRRRRLGYGGARGRRARRARLSSNRGALGSPLGALDRPAAAPNPGGARPAPSQQRRSAGGRRGGARGGALARQLAVALRGRRVPVGPRLGVGRPPRVARAPRGGRHRGAARSTRGGPSPGPPRAPRGALWALLGRP